MTEKDRIEVEVCVVGGGPAGSAAARRLSQLGHRVTLIERNPFPRHRVGESLPSPVLRWLELLGVRKQIEDAGFVRGRRSFTRWSSTNIDSRTEAGEPSFVVDRGRFDSLLLEAAMEAGAEVIQSVQPGRPERLGRHAWRVLLRKAGKECELRARFLVDATGKRGLLPRERRLCSPRTLALYGYWRQTPLPAAETRVEAGPNEWSWGVSLPDGSFNATVFVDCEQLAGIKRRDWPRFYLSLVDHTHLLRPCLAGVLDGPVRISDASSYYSTEPIQDDFIQVGEAAFSIDPLSSQGVQAALASAFQGAVAVHTILNRPARTDDALTFYRGRQWEAVVRNARTAAARYARQRAYPESPFWRKRTLPIFGESPTPERNTTPLSGTIRVALSEKTRIISTPVLHGDLIGRVPAVHHPAWDRPVAYLGEIALAPLLADLSQARTVTEVLGRWFAKLPSATAGQIFEWLWSEGVIIPDGKAFGR
jgi:flavin-dependent dehydrogenase